FVVHSTSLIPKASIASAHAPHGLASAGLPDLVIRAEYRVSRLGSTPIPANCRSALTSAWYAASRLGSLHTDGWFRSVLTATARTRRPRAITTPCLCRHVLVAATETARCRCLFSSEPRTHGG